MFDYCYKYASWAGNFYSDPVEIISPDPRVTKVTLEVDKKMHNLETSVYFSGNYTKEEAQACADDVALWTLNQLSRYTDRYFGDLKFQGGSQIATNEDGTQIIEDFGSSAVVRIGLSGRFDIGYTPEEQAKIIKTALEQGRRDGDDKYAAYRAALVSEDDVTRFMNLYRILMSYANDSVNRTDELIKRIGGDLKLELHVTFNTERNIYETVFTRLRSELAHSRDSPPTATIEGMGKHLYSLKKIVKGCLGEVQSV